MIICKRLLHRIVYHTLEDTAWSHRVLLSIYVYLLIELSGLARGSLVESDSKARAAVVPLSLLHHIPLVAPRGRTLSLIKVVEELIYQ